MSFRRPRISQGVSAEDHISSMYAEALKRNDPHLLDFIRKHWLNKRTKEFFSALEKDSAFVSIIDFSNTFETMVEAGLLRKYSKNKRHNQYRDEQMPMLLDAAYKSNGHFEFVEKRTSAIKADLVTTMHVYKSIGPCVKIEPLWAIQAKPDVFLFEVGLKNPMPVEIAKERLHTWCKDELGIDDYFIYDWQTRQIYICFPKQYADQAVTLNMFYNLKQC